MPASPVSASESAFLLDLARALVLAPSAPTRLDATGADVPALLSLGARHGLAGATVAALLDAGTAPRPDLEARRVMTAASGLAHVSDVRLAVDVLLRAGVPAALAPTPAAELALAGVLPDGTGLGVLTSRARLADARDALVTAGFLDRSSPERVLVAAAARPDAPVPIQTSAPGLDAGGLDTALQRRLLTALAGGQVGVLDPADRLVALAGRAADHHWRTLDHIVACGRLLAAGERATTQQVAVRTAALLLREILDVNTPMAARAETDAEACRLASAAATALRDRLSPAPAALPRPPVRARGREVWVAGFPSLYGGADTELDHAIDLLRSRDVAVHLVPMFGADQSVRQSVLDRGCRIHDYRPDIFRDRIVVSFCNGEFLKALPDIMHAGRPARVVWFNCMTWLFDREKEAHQQGWIDLFGFQSQYQRCMLEPILETWGPVRTFSYQPYFSPARATWRYRDWNGTYQIGRISRDDGAKFASDTWQIFDRVLVPAHLHKKVYVLGFGPNAEARIGPAPAGLDWQTWGPGGIPAERFYRTIDTMVHKTGGSRENYPRVLLEAWAYGAVPVVERDFSFPELVVHGETGFMASDSDEMSYHASWLAHHPDEHRRIAEQGRRFLETRLADPEACWKGWQEALSV